MGLYIPFPQYDPVGILKRPVRSRVELRNIAYIFEISCNKLTEGLVLNMYDGITEAPIVSGKAITKGTNLMQTVNPKVFPRDIAIFGDWLIADQYDIRKAFGVDFRLYVGGENI